MRNITVLALIIFLAACSTPPKDPGVPLMVNPVHGSGDNVPVKVLVDLPEKFAEVPPEQILVVLKELDSEGAELSEVTGQLVNAGDGQAELWWILPKVEYGNIGSWKAYFEPKSGIGKDGFRWKNNPGQYIDLLYNGKRKLRYMYAFEGKDPVKAIETYKPYHHVFDEKGVEMITKGPGGKYTHHRGIFLGWNKLSFNGKTYDFWHMTGAVQKHERFVERIDGPVLAKSSCLIQWSAKDAGVILAEGREVTIFNQPDPTMILMEVRTILNAIEGDVVLDGDPEHAGFQYRPHNDVAEGEGEAKASANYLFHEDEIDPLKDQNPPWVALNYKLNGKEYSVQHMTHGDNKKPYVYSAYRDYGRFGSFGKATIKKGEYLALAYRIYIKAGAMPSREELDRNYKMFMAPPVVEVVAVLEEE